ncbi:MAG: alpha/beta fold hydrolase [Bacteroidales bacterium]|nr:alpha/beta fold hydrolase [Bacteroidales bacterium]
MNAPILIQSIPHYQTFNGEIIENLNLSYQVFGKKLQSAPVVLVNHALTGNSDVCSEAKGWWKTIIGKGKVIDTDKFTVIAINIPGNGYHNELIENYKAYTAKDIAQLFIYLLKSIQVTKLQAAIGGSLGGGIAWEMAALEPEMIQYLIPIASDWKSSDWVIGHNFVQESILNTSTTPLETARMMAMLFYRTPASLEAKFHRLKMKENSLFQIESWLKYHGTKLENRFQLLAYQMMNHLLTTVDISLGKASFEEAAKPIQSSIIQIGINSDLFFSVDENRKTQTLLNQIGVNNEYHEIESIHGHDAFLIEFEQLTTILKPLFKC